MARRRLEQEAEEKARTCGRSCVEIDARFHFIRAFGAACHLVSKGLCFLTWNELRERSFKSRQGLGNDATSLEKGLPLQAEDAAATALTDLEQKARDKVTMVVEAEGSSQHVFMRYRILRTQATTHTHTQEMATKRS